MLLLVLIVPISLWNHIKMSKPHHSSLYPRLKGFPMFFLLINHLIPKYPIKHTTYISTTFIGMCLSNISTIHAMTDRLTKKKLNVTTSPNFLYRNGTSLYNPYPTPKAIPPIKMTSKRITTVTYTTLCQVGFSIARDAHLPTPPDQFHMSRTYHFMAPKTAPPAPTMSPVNLFDLPSCSRVIKIPYRLEKMKNPSSAAFFISKSRTTSFFFCSYPASRTLFASAAFSEAF